MPRRRVLISAYACGPIDESEAGAGWAFAVGAAAHHDVWVVTRTRFREAISAALAADPVLSSRMNLVYVDLSPAVLRWKRRGADVYWYYALWQRRLARTAQQLHAEVGFDVAHHVTFANDWLPCGLQRLRGVPLVWGPVGGATYLPLRMARWVGLRGFVGEMGRSILTRFARRVWGDPMARRAALVVAQNAEVAHRFRYARRVLVEPNAALEPTLEAPSPPRQDGKRAVFVGRLVPWKGGRLAIRAMTEPALAGWTLEVYGTGRDAQHLAALASRIGVGERVIFKGHQPRSAVLAAYRGADALLFPSLHDSAGWAVGEASAAGCPVVCLDKGGPPLLAGPNGYVVSIGQNVVADLAAALVRAGRAGGTPYPRWSSQRLATLVRDWYTDATATPRPG